MHRTVLLSVVPLLFACGASHPEAPPPNVGAAEPAPKPRCRAADDNQPADATSKMNGLQRDIRHCFALGSGNSAGVATVQVRLTVAADGGVRDVTIGRADGSPTAIECTEKALRSTTFSKFCGDDVPISWTYTIH